MTFQNNSTREAASGVLGNFEISQAGINANYNMVRVLALSTSFRVENSFLYQAVFSVRRTLKTLHCVTKNSAWRRTCLHEEIKQIKFGHQT